MTSEEIDQLRQLLTFKHEIKFLYDRRDVLADVQADSCGKAIIKALVESGPMLIDMAEECLRVRAERDEARDGYHELDRNWSTVHEAAMGAIREATGDPDATVSEIVGTIARLYAATRERSRLERELRQMAEKQHQAELSLSRDFNQLKAELERAAKERDETTNAYSKILAALERVKAERDELQQQRDAALAVIQRYGGIDGDHHKSWVLDCIVRELTGEKYAEWVVDFERGEDGPKTFKWDPGIPP